MPRRRRRAGGVSSAYQQVQKQAHALLQTLRREINNKEAELRQLRNEAARLGQLTGGMAGRRGPGAPSKHASAAAKRSGGRVNWRTVLQRLPKQFKASNVRSVRGLSGKRPSEIFAAITRWIESGLVKRKSRGLYERAA